MELQIEGFGVIEVPEPVTPESYTRAISDAITAFHNSPESGRYFDMKPRIAAFGSTGDVGAIIAAEPTLRQRFINRAVDFMTSPNDSQAERMQALRRARSIASVLEFIPGIGESVDASDAARAFQDRNYVDAAVLTAAAAVGAVPMLGDAGKAAIGSPAVRRRIADLVGESRQAKAELGNMAGNVSVRELQPIAKRIKEIRAELARYGVNELGEEVATPAARPAARQASDATSSSDYAYRGSHAAPRIEGGNTLDNLSDIFPEDIYSSEGVRYYGTGSPEMDRETINVIQALRGRPDAEVEVFRAVPRGQTDINAGDWVTVNRQYAENHGEAALGGDYEIVSKKVRASELATDGDIHEWGYSPRMLEIADEGDIESIATGQPVRMGYVHNPQSAATSFGDPSQGDRFLRDVEPSGRYITPTSQANALNAGSGLEGGVVEFRNPLVVDNNGLQWKREISDQYDGLTGRELSEAIRADGYDAIITVERGARFPYITETVDLTDAAWSPAD